MQPLSGAQSEADNPLEHQEEGTDGLVDVKLAASMVVLMEPVDYRVTGCVHDTAIKGDMVISSPRYIRSFIRTNGFEQQRPAEGSILSDMIDAFLPTKINNFIIISAGVFVIYCLRLFMRQNLNCCVFTRGGPHLQTMRAFFAKTIRTTNASCVCSLAWSC